MENSHLEDEEILGSNNERDVRKICCREEKRTELDQGLFQWLALVLATTEGTYRLFVFGFVSLL